jgi:hypothetical protein
MDKTRGVRKSCINPKPETEAVNKTTIWSLGKSPINIDELCHMLKQYPDYDNASILENGFRYGF